MVNSAKPLIPYKVFRHFAVVTVVVTGFAALMINGEDSGEDQRRQGTQQRAAESRRAAPPLNVRRGAKVQTAFAHTDTQNFGQPTIEVRRNSVGSGANPAAASELVGREPIPGYSPAYLDALTEAEYQQLLQDLQAAGMLDPAAREHTIAELLAKSRQRSSTAIAPD